MKKLITIILAISLFFTNASVSFAQRPLGGCGADGNQVCSFGDVVNNPDGVGLTIGKIIQFVFVVAAILALGFLVFGGIKWLTSGGDKEAVANARNTIISAIVGLVIIFLAYFLLNIVLLFLTGNGLEAIQIPRFGGQGAPGQNPSSG